jgi:hypothetical protein
MERGGSPAKSTNISPRATMKDVIEEGDSDDSIGPALPGQGGRRIGRMGPSIPSMQDLELRRGMF